MSDRKRKFVNSDKWSGEAPRKGASSQKWMNIGPTSVKCVEGDVLDAFIAENDIVSTTDWEPTQNGRILRITGINQWKRLTITHYSTGTVAFQGDPALASKACRLLSHFLGNDLDDSSDGDVTEKKPEAEPCAPAAKIEAPMDPPPPLQVGVATGVFSSSAGSAGGSSTLHAAPPTRYYDSYGSYRTPSASSSSSSSSDTTPPYAFIGTPPPSGTPEMASGLSAPRKQLGGGLATGLFSSSSSSSSSALPPPPGIHWRPPALAPPPGMSLTSPTDEKGPDRREVKEQQRPPGSPPPPPPPPPARRPPRNAPFLSRWLTWLMLFLVAGAVTDLPGDSSRMSPRLFGPSYASDSEGDGPALTRRTAAVPVEASRPARTTRVTSKVAENLQNAANKAATAKSKKVREPKEAEKKAFIVEGVTEHRVVNGRLQFSVKWEGYPLEHVDRWQSAEHFIPQVPLKVSEYLSTLDRPALPTISDRPITGMKIVSEKLFFYQENRKKGVTAASMCAQQPQLVSHYLRSDELGPPPSEPASAAPAFAEPSSPASSSVPDVLSPPASPSSPPSSQPSSPAPRSQLPSVSQSQAASAPLPSQAPLTGFGGANILTAVPGAHGFQRNLLPIMVEAHVHSAPLRRLVPTRFLRDEQKIAWRKSLVDFYAHAHTVLQKWRRNHDPLLALNLILEFAQFPSRVLLEQTTLTKSRKETKVFIDGVEQSWVVPASAAAPPQEHSSRDGPPSTFTHDQTIAKRSVKLYKSGRKDAASKTLHSLGTAPRTAATRDALRELTIPQQRSSPKPAVTADLPRIKGQTVKRVKSAAMKVGSLDVYGWSDDMLSLVINCPATATCPTPLQVHEDIISMLSATSQVPDAVAYVVTAGFHTALNKVSPGENESRVSAGDPPKIRPVNSGTMLAKHVGSDLLRTPQARKAREKMGPIQKGVGTKNGMDKAVHLLRAAYRSRMALVSVDGSNAFNALYRKAISKAVESRWPEAAPFCEKYYNLAIPVLYVYYDDGGALCVEVSHSWEGVKQGDTVASDFYSITAGFHIYEPLSAAVPVATTAERTYNVNAVAAMDDFTAIWECPPIGSNAEEWRQWYVQIAAYLIKFDEIANPIGIFRNSKGKILVPLDAPPPPPAADTFGIDLGELVVRDGIIELGSPIGTDAFMLAYATEKAAAASGRVSAIASLCPDEPQVALGMLSSGASCSLDYLTRTTPHSPILPALVAFDDHLMKTTLGIVCPPSVTDLLPLAKVDTAKLLLQLPIRNNGLAIFPTADKAPASFLSSFIASASDPLLAKLKSTLLPYIAEAVDRFASLAGLDVNKASPVSTILPADCSKLLSTPYTSRLQNLYYSRRGIMGVLTSYLQQVRLQNLRQSVLPPEGADLSLLSRREKSEILHVLTTTSRGRIASVVVADLAFRDNRIGAEPLRAALCYNLSLPATSFGSESDTNFPYPVQKCAKDGGAVFDTCGDHATGCAYCHSARSATHSGLRGAYVRFARAANFTVSSEPSTYSILQGLFSTPDQLKALFPKYNDPAASRRRVALEASLGDVRNAPNAANRREIVAGIVASERSNPPPAAAAEGVAVRADVLAVPDDGRGRALLVDVTGIHCSSKESASRQLRYHVQLQRRSNVSFAANFHLASNAGDSPAVAKAVSQKHKKYGLIETLANIQAAGAGPQLPLKFVAGVMTHRCEMATELVDSIEYCTGRYKAGLRVTPDIDGRTPARAAASFRARFKQALCAQMVAGFGRQLLATSAMGLSAAINA